MKLLAGSWLGRCAIDALLRRRARCRLVELDHTDAAPSQARLLRGLVHRARNTRFGRDHDFARIRTPADFRRLVPLRSAARFWQQYGQPFFPELNGVLWPEPASHLLPTGDVLGETLPFVPLTRGLLDAQRSAALTALGLALPALPRTPLLSDRVLFVGGGAAPVALDGSGPAGSAEELLLRSMPSALRPHLAWSTSADGGPLLAEDFFRVSPEEAARLSVGCVVGATGRLRRFFERLHPAAGWPRLRLVFCGDDGSGVTKDQLREAVGSDAVRFVRYLARPEGVLASEDSRYGLLRLLIGDGLYYEFVPAETLGASEPVRLGIADVEPGIRYALALTSPAGLWACLTGLTVRFARHWPLLLESVEAAAPAAPLARAEAPAQPLSLPPPHRRSGDIPAMPPGMPFHTPWSAREGRG
jgi:hypothetical protein